MEGLRANALATCFRAELDPTWLLGPPQQFADYVPPAEVDVIDGEVRLVLSRGGDLRGVAGWFEADLAPGVSLANPPGSDTHWGQQILPLPVTAVKPGDVLTLRVRAGAEDIIWNGELVRGDEVVARFSREALVATAPPVAKPWQPWTVDAIEAANRRGVEAWAEGRHVDAAAAWDEATRGLGPEHAVLAAPIYENLGIALQVTGRPVPAIRALLRALDGDPSSREQSLRILVLACLAAGRVRDATRHVAAYERAFGPHPDWRPPGS